jgi:protoporphyrinogen/coproporphyrinogen III oxidase
MPKHIVILGAGISGLSLAWFLKKRMGKKISVTLLEKSMRAGGWIHTIESRGFLFEQGPRSCRSQGTGIETLKLIEELGLQQQVIVADSAARKRFLYHDQKLKPLPRGPLSFLLSPLTRGFLKTLWREWRVPPSSASDETIYDFVVRRLSPEIAEKLIDPLTSGIYAGDIRHLSIRSCYPMLYNLEQEEGSLLKGMLKKARQKEEPQSPFIKAIRKHSLFSLKQGMETLTRELAKRLEYDILLNCEVKALHFFDDAIEVEADHGRIFRADHVFAALPAQALAPLIRPHHEVLHEKIDEITHTSVAVVNLGWKDNVLKHKGFGYLIPSNQREEIMGVVWDSSVFPQHNQQPEETRLTVMIGGAHMSNFASYTEQDFIDKALEAMSRHLQIDQKPDTISFKRAQNAIPQYHLGHADRVDWIHKQLPLLSHRMTLIGSSWHGVSINDCIAQSRLQAEKYEQRYRRLAERKSIVV